MSASENNRVLAGLTLDDVLRNQKRGGEIQLHQRRTLLDIIKEDETNKKDRRSWKAFKDKLRLKRAGSAWTSSIHIPASDIPIIIHPHTKNTSQFARANSVQIKALLEPNMSDSPNTHQVHDLDHTDDSVSSAPTKPQFNRRNSTRFAADTSDNSVGTLRPQLSRRNSTSVPSEPFKRGRMVTFRDCLDDDETDDDDKKNNLDMGRALSAREAVAAQEAAEAAAAAEAEEEEEEEQAPVMMSLMDLLEETDREMGLEGSRYILSDDEFDEDDEEVDEDDDGKGAMEYSCCICMVRHKAAAFMPCGHTFCRMCSRELTVSRGNCPLCNNFILEVLDIF